jgi:hypothetical protein
LPVARHPVVVPVLAVPEAVLARVGADAVDAVDDDGAGGVRDWRVPPVIVSTEWPTPFTTVPSIVLVRRAPLSRTSVTVPEKVWVTGSKVVTMVVLTPARSPVTCDSTHAIAGTVHGMLWLTKVPEMAWQPVGCVNSICPQKRPVLTASTTRPLPNADTPASDQ